MKRYLFLATVVCFMLSAVTPVLAAPVEFGGDLRLEGRSYNDFGDKGSFFELRARLNFETKVDENTTLFGRFSKRSEFGDAKERTKNVSDSFDWCGVKLDSGDWKVSLGRQAVTLGQGAIIETGYDAAGSTQFFDGIVASSKLGSVDVKLIGGKNAFVKKLDTADAAPVEIYGVDFTGKVGDKLQLGGAWASLHALKDYDFHNNDSSRRTWAVNMKYDASPNFALNGEYVRSNDYDMSKGYFVAGTFKWEKNTFSIQYNNVQDASVEPLLSGIGVSSFPIYDNGALWGEWYKGYTYTYTHEVNKNLSVHAIYQNLKTDWLTDRSKAFVGGATWKL